MKQRYKLRILFMALVVSLTIIPAQRVPASLKNTPEALVMGTTYRCDINDWNSYCEYNLTLTSSGRFQVLLTVTDGACRPFICDYTGNKIYDHSWTKGKGTYPYSFDLTAGEYTFRIYSSSIDCGWCTFIPSFTPSGETINEGYTNRNNDVGSATAYTSGTTVTGQLAINDDVDMYKCKVSGKGTVKVSLVSDISSTRFEILNDAGTFKKSEWDITPGNHTYTYKDVPKGTYYISFYRVSDNTGTYKFSISTPGSPSGAAPAPKKITLKKPVNQAGRKMVVKWSAFAKMSGYEIQIATNRGFSKGSKKYTVSSAGTSSKTIKSLKKGKTYYVRIRSYVKASGKKKYSAWSSVKSVKIKK